MSVTLFYLMFQYVYSPDKKFSPHFLMGPMLNWNKIKIMGMDCFLIRWLLARNMFSFFCLIVIIVCLIF
ncbi:MAG: hypothetical protein LBC54_00040 [Bacteroidales bacterium OttesenSCG-928-I14]|nr:hypothetical protein [Bacteroidales bacterium OttesenSCG-928-I14]